MKKTVGKEADADDDTRARNAAVLAHLDVEAISILMSSLCMPPSNVSLIDLCYLNYLILRDVYGRLTVRVRSLAWHSSFNLLSKVALCRRSRELSRRPWTRLGTASPRNSESPITHDDTAQTSRLLQQTILTTVVAMREVRVAFSRASDASTGRLFLRLRSEKLR